MTALLLLAAATIEVRVMTREHPARLTVESSRGEETLVDGPLVLPEGTWILRAKGGPPHAYEGTIAIVPSEGELAIVVRMDRERYVAHAVAAETDPGTPAAALEAQAIVARSWARAAGRRHADADVCDLAHCQVLSKPMPREHVEAARRASERTRGTVLRLPAGAIAAATYHAACGGRTADPREVFGGVDRTGAGSVEDPGCDGPRWRATLPRETVERAAAEVLGRRVHIADLQATMGEGDWLRTVMDRSTGSIAFGDAFARALGRAAGWNVIRGGRFRWTSSGDRIVIEGVGLGHGVGLCQRGAARRARAGASAAEILAPYFPSALAAKIGCRES
jgi:stage II sporulation protein D